MSTTKPAGYKKILFASDLAPNSRCAFEAAVDLSSRCSAELTILHVFEYGQAVPDKRIGDQGELKRLHDDAARRLDEQVQCAEAAGIDCEGILDSGGAAEVILETISTSRADLAIVGTNALRGIERMVFGSDAEVVLRKAGCPVLVVGPHVQSGNVSKKHGPVLFATDFRPTAVYGMRAASQFAKAYGAELECVHVLPPDYYGNRTKVVPRVVQEALQRIVAEEVGLESHPLCTVEYCGSVSEGITKFALKVNARAIVLGVRQSGPLVAHAAPGVAFRVIASAHCPVLTIATSAATESVTAITDRNPRVLAESFHGTTEMRTGTLTSAEVSTPRPKRNYLNNEEGLASWLLTVDHKRIALLYLISVSFFFLVGGMFAMFIRMHLLTPEGSLMSSDTYNKVFTMHGVVMIFFVLIPAVPAVLGNFVLPMMLGARDLAFPKINLLSWYCYVAGAVLLLYTVIAGGIDTGWTFTAPLSTRYVNTNVISAGLAAFMAGFSSIFTGINFIVTIHKMRAPGLTWMRLPLFVWAHYATSIIMILGTPVVAITIVLVAIERLVGIGIFDPAIGGDPILFQHLFWFYSHPAVYVMLLPGMGVVSEVIACFSRKRIFGYKAVAFSSVSIAVFGFFVWEHHMFIMGVSSYSALVFSLLTMLVAVPSAIKVFNWSCTLVKGSITFEAPMIYALCFIGLFVVGGCTGVFLGTLGMDVHLTETYFVVAHFHFVMVGATLMAYLAGLHFWWPKMFGRMYPEFPAKVCAVTIFVGFFFTFGPQFILGYLGMPRRYAAYPPEWQTLNVFSTAGATIMGIGYFMTGIYLLWSLFYGEKATSNPWNAAGLEWQTSSPPITQNFLEVPVVDHEAYNYDEIDAHDRALISGD